MVIIYCILYVIVCVNGSPVTNWAGTKLYEVSYVAD